GRAVHSANPSTISIDGLATADAKRAIATLPVDSKLLLRGYMRSAGTDHYLDISLFKIES
ncbi:MAG: hypothetical protein NTX64_03240, partial [Elusimicrobia bacterium]|nr:hypothetical protein [Elusimicrobiota bacterium]